MLERAQAKTAEFAGQVEVTLGNVSDPPIAPSSVDLVLARHILWTLPDPRSALARWRLLLRPGGRFLLIEGRWWSVGDEGYSDQSRMPWAGGVCAADLAAAIEPLVARIEIVPLTDPALWGKEVADERYLLVADL
jgi:SAM-dependent methyltransferase